MEWTGVRVALLPSFFLDPNLMKANEEKAGGNEATEEEENYFSVSSKKEKESENRRRGERIDMEWRGRRESVPSLVSFSDLHSYFHVPSVPLLPLDCSDLRIDGNSSSSHSVPRPSHSHEKEIDTLQTLISGGRKERRGKMGRKRKDGKEKEFALLTLQTTAAEKATTLYLKTSPVSHVNAVKSSDGRRSLSAGSQSGRRVTCCSRSRRQRWSSACFTISFLPFPTFLSLVRLADRR